MESIQTCIDRVTAHLATLEIELKCKKSPKAAMSEIEIAQEKLGVKLPDAYIDFITQFSNGLELSWDAGDDEKAPFASFEIENLETSVGIVLGWREWRFYDESEAMEYGFPHVNDSEAAILTNRLMHNWLPIHGEGNGDSFSINLNQDGFGNVIFDEHDWLDDGSGHNGNLMATDLHTFIEAWANVCFSQPKSLWWPPLVGVGGVDWILANLTIVFA